MGRLTALAVAVAAAWCSIALSTSAARAECGEVTMTDFDWQSAQVNAAVTKFILEKGYGCNVAMVPSSTATALVSLAENGKPDIVVEMWENAAAGLLKMRDDGKVAFLNQVLSDGGQQGWWVPQYMVDEHPELAKLDGVLANADLLGKRFYSCPDGWTCKNTNGNMAKAVDLEGKGFEIFVPGSGETLASSLAAAYADKKPWFGYYWAPTPLLGQNPMVLVDVGPYDKAVFDCNTTPDCTTPAMSSYPRDAVWTVVTSDFKTREPEVTEMLTKMAFTNLQMGEVLGWQDANKATADEAAVHFLTTYKDVWAAWLNEGARAKLANLLQ